MLTYLVPLCTSADEDVSELAHYLRGLAATFDDVMVVDNSDDTAFVRHRAAFGSSVRLLRSELETANGKVGNVLTGVRHAHYEAVVIADDDVRYSVDELHSLERLLHDADVVRPQNYFDPQPWHARFDTARTLLNRVTGGDWPGTLAVRRSILAAGGYDGDAMFENLELVRTARARGGRERVALDLLVARRPPTAGHFARQQVRQAYDEFARPARLLASLAVLPALVAGRRRPALITTGALVVVAVAETGRRRAGGTRVFPASSSLLAPVFVVWRSLCSWVALGARARGGVRYRGRRLRVAAHSPRALRRYTRSSTTTGISREVASSYCLKPGINAACAS